MALLGTNRGVGSNAVSATTVAIVPGTNFTAGSLAVLAVAYDNAGAQGADPYVSISDNSGNAWISRLNALNDPGAANAGSALRVFTSPVGTLTTATTITITFGSNTTNKTWTLTEFVSDTDGGFVDFNNWNSVTGSNTTPSIPITVSIETGDAILGAFGSEGIATITPDSDTLNGTWSTQQNTSVGTGTGGTEVASQYKIVTAPGSQTYNLTLSATGDYCIGYILLREAIGSSYDPFGRFGFFGM